MKDKLLTCINCYEPFNFTVGKSYRFTYIYDPEGWEVKDDYGHKEVFFNTKIMFI